MGCDIHLQLQVKVSYWSEAKKWRSASFQPEGGYMDRDYGMFALMASVRGSYEKSLEPKGKIPDNEIPTEWRKYITSDGKGEDECTKEDALRWGNPIVDEDGIEPWTIDPDLHSFSFLSYKEFKRVIKNYDNLSEYRCVETEYHVLLDIMKTYKKQGVKSRIVFCFDN